MHKAAGMGKVAELKMLIASSLQDIEVADVKHGMTALHLAAGNNHFDCIKLLLDAGAVPDPQDNKGRTPAYVAKDAKCRKILQDAVVAER